MCKTSVFSAYHLGDHGIFLFSLQLGIFSSSYLIVLSRTFIAMLTRNRKGRNFFLVSNLRRKAFDFSTLHKILGLNFIFMAFIQVEVIWSIPCLLGAF
jgi:hypothetical protein